MGKLIKKDWLAKPMVEKILSSFNVPKIPRQIEEELKINNIKMKAFIEKKLVMALNPDAKKGRHYLATRKAR